MNNTLEKRIDFLRGRFAILEHISLLSVLALPPERRNALVESVKLFDIDTISPLAPPQTVKNEDFRKGFEGQRTGFIKSLDQLDEIVRRFPDFFLNDEPED